MIFLKGIFKFHFQVFHLFQPFDCPVVSLLGQKDEHCLQQRWQGDGRVHMAW